VIPWTPHAGRQSHPLHEPVGTPVLSRSRPVDFYLACSFPRALIVLGGTTPSETSSVTHQPILNRVWFSNTSGAGIATTLRENPAPWRQVAWWQWHAAGLGSSTLPGLRGLDRLGRVRCVGASGKAPGLTPSSALPRRHGKMRALSLQDEPKQGTVRAVSLRQRGHAGGRWARAAAEACSDCLAPSRCAPITYHFPCVDSNLAHICPLDRNRPHCTCP